MIEEIFQPVLVIGEGVRTVGYKALIITTALPKIVPIIDDIVVAGNILYSPIPVGTVFKIIQTDKSRG